MQSKNIAVADEPREVPCAVADRTGVSSCARRAARRLEIDRDHRLVTRGLAREVSRVLAADEADGHPEIRGVTPLKGPMNGKGGVSWIEITSTVNNPELSPLATEFLEFVQSPEMAHTVAFAEGTYNPVAQMGNKACFELFTADELDAIQWDSLDEEMSRCVEYDIVPDYDKLLDIMERLNRERGATFIFSTHDPRVMERARRVVHMVDGRVERDEARA